MGDLYASYAELDAAETEGVDYLRTLVEPAGATWTSIAVHGGGIEAGSGEMAQQVAGDRMRYYEFDGIKASGNFDLHITSTLFDEPMCLATLSTSPRTLSFHGYTGTTGVAETAIGGLDTDLKARVQAALEAAGFAVVAAPGEIDGADPDNICNKNASGAGVQLELSRALRESFFPGGSTTKATRDDPTARTAAFHSYAAAVQSVYEGAAKISMSTAGLALRHAELTGTSLAAVDIEAVVSANALPVGGFAAGGVTARVGTTEAYAGYIRLETDGSLTLQVSMMHLDSDTRSVNGSVTLPFSFVAGQRYRLRYSIAGATQSAKAWVDGTAEPADWQVVDTGATELTSGAIGAIAFRSSSNTNAPMTFSFEDYSATTKGFIVVRGVNGLALPHAAGTDVALANPSIVAF